MSQSEQAVNPSALTPPPPSVMAPARPAKAALPLLLAGWFGLLAHLLTNGTGANFGLNLLVWITLFASVMVWVVGRKGQRLAPEGVTLLGVALLFALSFTVWAAPGELGFLNVLAMLLSLLLGSAFLRFPGLGGLSVAAMIGTAFTGWLRLFYGPLALLERFPWARYRPAKGAQAGRWGLGALLSAPVVLVFGGLLASADQGFAKLLSGLTHWNLDGLFSNGLSVLFWTALAGGLIYPALMALRPTLFPEKGVELPRLGLIEIGLPLASLAALFVVFLLTQLPYYLSGSALPDGVTFAEYIRQGFGELMTVAFLTLALLLASHAFTREEVRAALPYRLLNLAVLAPLALVILSAANRWRLYTLAYGLSEIRVLGAAFLAWVVLALGWLAWLLWRGDLRRFAYPALLLGFGTLLLTTALNPAALIARLNVERQTAAITNTLRTQPQQANIWELTRLGAGAVPTIINHLDSLTRPAIECDPKACNNDRQSVIDQLHDQYDAPRDLRAWNAAQARAHKLVQTLPPRSPKHDRGYSD